MTMHQHRALAGKAMMTLALATLAVPSENGNAKPELSSGPNSTVLEPQDIVNRDLAEGIARFSGRKTYYTVVTEARTVIATHPADQIIEEELSYIDSLLGRFRGRLDSEPSVKPFIDELQFRRAELATLDEAKKAQYKVDTLSLYSLAELNDDGLFVGDEDLRAGNHFVFRPNLGAQIPLMKNELGYPYRKFEKALNEATGTFNSESFRACAATYEFLHANSPLEIRDWEVAYIDELLVEFRKRNLTPIPLPWGHSLDQEQRAVKILDDHKAKLLGWNEDEIIKNADYIKRYVARFLILHGDFNLWLHERANRAAFEERSIGWQGELLEDFQDRPKYSTIDDLARNGMLGILKRWGLYIAGGIGVLVAAVRASGRAEKLTRVEELVRAGKPIDFSFEPGNEIQTILANLPTPARSRLRELLLYQGANCGTILPFLGDKLTTLITGVGALGGGLVAAASGPLPFSIFFPGLILGAPIGAALGRLTAEVLANTPFTLFGNIIYRTIGRIRDFISISGREAREAYSKLSEIARTQTKTPEDLSNLLRSIGWSLPPPEAIRTDPPPPDVIVNL